VIIPAYNEEKHIGTVLDDLLKLKRHGLRFDILVVDDCSMDRTSEIAVSKGAMVVRHEKNMGEEAGIQTGLRYALENGYDFVIKIDGDNQHNPRDIPGILRMLKQGFDIVIGSRQRGYKEPLLFKLGRSFCSLLVSVLMRTRVRDASSGFYGFSRTSVLLFRWTYKSTKMLKDDLTNNIERLIIARKYGLNIIEIPVNMRSREGHSKCYTSYDLLRFPFVLMKSLANCLAFNISNPIQNIRS